MTVIQYCFTPVSPWTYLGHARMADIAKRAGASIELMPVDYGVIFPASGGLPLGKRAPQRQAYRLVELRRFSEHLKLPLTLQPKHFPVDATAAALLIVATQREHSADAAMRLTGALLREVWVKEGNISDKPTLQRILQDCALPATLMDTAQQAAVAERYQANTQRALEMGVFGAPSYVVDGEIFWGQDRVEFLARRLGLAA